MALRYRIQRISPTRFQATPMETLPSWQFDIPDWAGQDTAEIISEADITRPCGLGAVRIEDEKLPDMSDVTINFILADDLGSGSLRS